MVSGNQKTPRSSMIAHLLILLNAVIWFIFAVIVAADLHPAIPEMDFIRWAFAFLALLTAIVSLALFFLLRRRNRFAYWLTIGMLLVLSVLTITDDFGTADLAFLAICVIALVLLLKDRGWYHQSNSGDPENTQSA